MEDSISNDQIQFQGYLTPEEVSGLASFLEQNEREYPLAFKGRHEVRNAITDRIKYVRKQNKSLCNTITVQGAPGAGKSSLLHQIEIDAGELQEQNVIVVTLESDEMHDAVSVLQGFLKCEGINVEDLWRSFDTRGQGRKDLKHPKLSSGLDNLLPSFADTVRNNPGMIWETIRDCLDEGDEPIFLMLVDESQNIDPTMLNKNTILTRLHSARNIADLKIIPVFAGLSDTGKCLEKLGITRRSRVDFILSGFSADEGRQVCVATIQKLGLDKIFTPNQISHIAHQLDLASDGWPRHLHNYLQALVREVSRSQREKINLDLNTVLDEGHDNRIMYYQTRLQVTGYRQHGKELNQIAKDHQSIDDKISYASLSGYFSDKNLNDEQIEEIIDAYVHNGILNERLDGLYEFPIPSLQTFLMCDRDVDKTKEMLYGGLREDIGGATEIRETAHDAH